MLGEYTEPITDGMRVRHDAQARFTVKAGKTVLEDGLTPIESIGGAMTRAGIQYNARAMSGGVAWWNPATGQPVSRPKVKIRLRPQDVLTGEQLCPCPKCTS
jgi:hypothetical protein